MPTPGPELRLRPTLFGGQINRVVDLLRDGCPEHGLTLAGAPECSDCRVIKFWEPEFRTPKGSFSTPAGYVECPRRPVVDSA